MNLQGRNLSQNLQGADVALVQSELAQLGYTSIPTTETAAKTFGAGALQAVQDFQRKRGLAVTGIVEAVTAKAINAAVDAMVPGRFVVSGTVHHQDGTALSGMTVRAFDKDMRSEQLLGEAKTDPTPSTAASGLYQIMYTADKFSRAEKKSADLVVRVFSPEGGQLVESAVLFNAPATATVNLVVAPVPVVSLSEYEQLVADLTPRGNRCQGNRCQFSFPGRHVQTRGEIGVSSLFPGDRGNRCQFSFPGRQGKSVSVLFSRETCPDKCHAELPMRTE
jgi:peptidoglycan hydrolase-like protein with peptidoglycan-binding domain